MRKFFNPELGPWRWLRRLADLLILSFYYLLASLTIVGSGPALGAAYSSAVAVFRRQEGLVWPLFWAAFRKFWRRGILISLILVLLAVNYLFLWPNFLLTSGLSSVTKGSLFYAIVFLSLFLLSYLLWYFALWASHPEVKSSQSERNFLLLALDLFFKLGLRGLLAVLIVGGGLFILGRTALYIWPLFTLPGLVFWALAGLFEPVLSQLDFLEQTDGKLFSA